MYCRCFGVDVNGGVYVGVNRESNVNEWLVGFEVRRDQRQIGQCQKAEAPSKKVLQD